MAIAGLGYRVEWRYVGSKRCPIPHFWQTDRLNVISLMRSIEYAYLDSN